MQYAIIDALGPFIDPKNPPHNWSKIPFSTLEEQNEGFDEIVNRFRIFIEKARSIGYNAISLDDMSHMVVLDFYSSTTKQKLKKFTQLYSELIHIAKENDMIVFVNLDILSFNEDIKHYVKASEEKIQEVMRMSLEYLFTHYEVAGIITRIGECDGVDVKGMFQSQLVIRSAKQARNFLETLLPLFEAKEKIWIYRTWTIGGTKVGDLMWNQDTYLKVFEGITSDSLVISMKYGVADFFRNMDLNPLFQIKGQKKIIELQTKREYELLGELPYYTGFEYERYYQEIQGNPEFAGIMVWCQTGGWGKSSRITFLENSSAFVELNTISTLHIFEGKSAEQEVQAYFKDSPSMYRFLELYNKLSGKILYPGKTKTRYFRKLYIPPILWVFWGNISINPFTASFVRYFYREITIKESELESLRNLGQECHVEDIDFYVDTLRILYKTRLSLHGKYEKTDMEKAIEIYSDKYHLLTFSLGNNKHSRILLTFFYFIFRKKHKYRLVDYVFFNKTVILLVYRIYRFFNQDITPKFLGKQAMPISEILK